MKKKLIKAVIFTLVCTTSLTLSACGNSGSTSKSGNAKKIVNVGIVNAPSGFNALDSSDQTQNNMTEILFKPLVELSSDLKFVPGLADSIDTTDNKTFIVKLNKKAKWTDGKPVTADDVMFTLNLITNPKVSATISSKFNMLAGLNDAGKNANGTDTFDGAKKVDDHTVNLITKQPVDKVVFEDLIGQYLKTVPQHVLKSVPLEEMFKASFFQNPNVTDGAFKLVTYKKDQYVQLTANKDYFRGAPKLSQLNFKIMQGTEITVQLQSGEIDTNDPLVGQIPNDDISKLKTLKNVTVTKGDPSGIQVMEINVNSVPDAKVRQAISYAINRKQIVDNLLKGAGEEIVGPYPKSSTFYNKDIDYPSYNVTKAKELLKEANWDSNKVLKLNVPTGNTVREQSANVIAQNLQEVGIKTQIQKYDFVTALSLAKKHQYDLFLAGFTFDPVNPDITAYIASGQVLDLSAYSNSQMDSLLAQGKVTIDKAKRTEIYNKVQELYVNDSPVVGTYAPKSMLATNKRVTYGGAKAFGEYADVEKWDVTQ